MGNDDLTLESLGVTKKTRTELSRLGIEDVTRFAVALNDRERFNQLLLEIHSARPAQLLAWKEQLRGMTEQKKISKTSVADDTSPAKPGRKVPDKSDPKKSTGAGKGKAPAMKAAEKSSEATGSEDPFEHLGITKRTRTELAGLGIHDTSELVAALNDPEMLRRMMLEVRTVRSAQLLAWKDVLPRNTVPTAKVTKGSGSTRERSPAGDDAPASATPAEPPRTDVGDGTLERLKISNRAVSELAVLGIRSTSGLAAALNDPEMFNRLIMEVRSIRPARLVELKRELCGTTQPTAPPSTEVRRYVAATRTEAPATVSRPASRFVYEGPMKEGIPDGPVRLIHKGHGTFEGEFRNGHANGPGVERKSDGTVYDGEYRDGRRNGHFSVSYPDGEKFIGEYGDGQRNGHGVCTLPDGTVYEGEYRDGSRNGLFSVRYYDDERYVGEYRDNLRNGHGIYSWPNGTIYEGEYVDGKRNGFFKEIKANGELYEGETKDDERHGHGTLRLPNGDVYVGNFTEGRIDGEGTYTRADGIVYEGTFIGGIALGHFRVSYPDGGTYDGYISYWKREVKGTMRFADGTVYEGGFDSDRFHGDGTLWMANGTVYEGEFRKGLPEGRGVQKSPDGNVYKGRFMEGMMHGCGTMRFRSGDVYEGDFWKGDINGSGTLWMADGTVYKEEFSPIYTCSGWITTRSGTYRCSRDPDGRFRWEE